MIMKLISDVRRSLYDAERCRGLTTEGSGTDGTNLAGGVVTVAPIHVQAASPRNGPLAPRRKSNHSDTQMSQRRSTDRVRAESAQIGTVRGVAEVSGM
jgi:hypothetical protein